MHNLRSKQVDCLEAGWVGVGDGLSFTGGEAMVTFANWQVSRAAILTILRQWGSVVVLFYHVFSIGFV